MSQYKLDLHSSDFYLSLFDQKKLNFFPYREAGHYESIDKKLVKKDEQTQSSIYLQESPAQAEFEFDHPDFTFGLSILLEGDTINEKLICLVKRVLSQIVEMDQRARQVPSKEDYKEELATVEITKDYVGLYYVSTEVNTSWYAYFKEIKSKFEFDELGFG